MTDSRSPEAREALREVVLDVIRQTAERASTAPVYLNGHQERALVDYAMRRLATLPDSGERPERIERALKYLDAVDRRDSEAARRISGLPLYSASPEFRSALTNVLAHRASPPEYPGLALVPVPDLDKLAALVKASDG
jgi:hypothetical protein